MYFKGASKDNTEVYVLDYEAHEEDLASGYPLSGARGNFVSSLLGSMSLLQSSRFACWQGQGREVVEKDIVDCNPKIIIGFGNTLIRIFTTTGRKITDVSGDVFDVSIGDRKYKYLSLVSPSYVLNRLDDQSLTVKFSQDLYKAFQVVVSRRFPDGVLVYKFHAVDERQVAAQIGV